MRGRVAVALLAAACASTRPDAARRDVADLVAEAGGPSDVIEARQSEESRAQVRKRVAELLQEPLTLERALQIAVLNNRGLQATLEELGVAQADLVEAGLLDNPTIGGDLMISTRGNGLGGGLGLSQNLLGVFLIPARRRVAKARLQHAVLTVADATLALVRDVKVAYVDVQAAVAMRDVHRTLAQDGRGRRRACRAAARGGQHQRPRPGAVRGVPRPIAARARPCGPRGRGRP